MNRLRQSTADIFRWPLWLGLLTAIGLGSALFGDAGWDALSWTALAVPLAVLGRKLSSRTSFRDGPQDQTRNLEIPGSR